MRTSSRWMLALTCGGLALVLSGGASRAASLGGVYALCRSYSASPASHFAAGRATRDITGHYFAKGAGTLLTGSLITLSETGNAYFEVLGSCPLPTGCIAPKDRLQSPWGLELTCSFNLPGQGTRSYDMHVPNSYTNLRAAPLLVKTRGNSVASPMLTEPRASRLQVLHDSDKSFIAILLRPPAPWPIGDPQPRDAGSEPPSCDCTKSPTACGSSGAPLDSNLVMEATKHAIAIVKIDQQRIYATSIDSGQGAVRSLTCNFASWFAAVAPLGSGARSASFLAPRTDLYITNNCNPIPRMQLFDGYAARDLTPSVAGSSGAMWWRSRTRCSAANMPVDAHRSDRWDPLGAHVETRAL